MGKLFHYKEWLTVADAAKHLSIVFGEDVAEADVLRLALDGHLKLSVRFVNLTPAKRTEIKPMSLSGFPGFETENAMIDNVDIEMLTVHQDKITQLEGVFNVPMIFGSRLDIERKHRTLVQGEILEEFNNDGVIVERDGRIFELQSEYVDNYHLSLDDPENASHEYIRSQIAVQNYCASSTFPTDSALVVLTDALREFEQSINGAPSSADKPISTTERAHVSDKLAYMNQAAAKFWGNADRDDRGTHPDNATVSAWLEEQGFSATLADKAATIIRPEWVPAGRKPKE